MASAARPARGSSQNVTATGEGERRSAWKSLSPGRGRPRIGAAPKLVRLVFSKLPSPAITENLTDQSRIRNNFVIAPRTAVLSPMAEAGPLPRYPLLRPLAREGGGHRLFCLSAKVRYRCCSVAVLPDAIKWCGGRSLQTPDLNNSGQKCIDNQAAAYGVLTSVGTMRCRVACS